MKRLRVVAASAALAVAFLTSASAQSAPVRKQAPGVNCVQFVKSVADVSLSGNAWKWWRAADGKYERGQRPSPGAIFVFKPSGRMVLGHVAVVSELVEARTIRVDHANWAPRGPSKGKVDRGVLVQDISPRNDWSLVRVWYDPADQFGRAYPTYGFIYTTGAVAPSAQPRYDAMRPDARPDVPAFESIEAAEDSARTVGVAERIEPPSGVIED